jgi:histidine triad (HIT) family protein
MASIFSKIVAGEIPCHKVAESDKFLAFLDVNPVCVGHTLVIPKEEINYIFDIEDELYQELMVFAKQVSKTLKSQVECKRIGVAVVGLEVPHAHVHLLPLNSMEDFDFGSKLNPPKEELEALASQLSKAH